MYLCIMNCYICKKETDTFTDRYVEKVCLECDARLIESDAKAKKFRDEYRKNHALCPNCGHDQFMTTLMGFPMHMDHPEDYKDLNNCTCSKCKNQHVTHDRTPKQI